MATIANPQTAAQIEEQAELQAAPPPTIDHEPAPGVPLDSLIDETARRAKERINTDEEQFVFDQRLAKLFVASGMFANDKKASETEMIAQAMVRIMLGRSMGFTQAEAMQGIDVINGRPSISSALRGARFQAAGYGWVPEWFQDSKGECAGCRLWIYYKGKALMKPRRNENGEVARDDKGNPIMEHVSEAFTRKDAQILLTTVWENNVKKRASVLEKENWKMTPRNMYFARAIANAQRFHAPAALGGMAIMSFEEAMDVEPAGGAAAIGVADEKPTIAMPQRKSAAPVPAPAEEVQGEANEDWPIEEELAKKGGNK